MNAFYILRDAWFFYSRNFVSIALLCLPLIALESIARLAVGHWLGESALPARDMLLGLVFYPLYVGALILFLDARSRGHMPPLRAVLARALMLWPALAVLAGLGSLAIMLGASLFVLPGLWVMVKIAFAEYLLVLRGLTPLAALKESFRQTRGHSLPVFGCIMLVLAPLWSVEIWLAAQLQAADGASAVLTVALDSLIGLAQLLATVALFRCYMLASEPAEVA